MRSRDAALSTLAAAAAMALLYWARSVFIPIVLSVLISSALEPVVRAAGICNTIPYFGPVIVAVGTSVVAFLQFGTLSMATLVAGTSLAITSLEGWLLMPMLTSRVVRTNEVAVLVALIFWSFVWGAWGALLAVPMLISFKACCDHVERLKPVGLLLGE